MTDDPRANPLAGNPFETRADLERAVRDLVDPLLPHFSPGRARVRLGSFAAVFHMADAELEGFARPLFGLVPLAAGGGRFDHWSLWQEGLAAGVDPDHPEHWTFYESTSQTMVEQAAIGLGLALVPELLWEPLSGRTQAQLVEWLRRIERYEPVRNNWQFFRVLVQLGLERVGAPFDRDAQARSLEMLDGFHLGDGWYADGEGGARDHYVPWAFHAYGLVFARQKPDHPLAEVFRERARRVAADFEAFFDPTGGVLPFGRSLTYRFAAAGFWAALAFAEEEALPWGVVKGLLLRHLRWWTTWPISDRDGVLSIGWTYSNPWMREQYNSPGSPYWAMKAFLCLALPEDHAFWRAEEMPLEPTERSLPSPGMRIGRDRTQTVALSGAHGTGQAFDQGSAKYGRLAYSSVFAPTLELALWGRVLPGDACLVLHAPEAEPRLVRHVETSEIVSLGGDAGDVVYSRWRAGEGVLVHTLLAGGAPWHLRLHRVVTDRSIVSLETGFATGGFDALTGGFESGDGMARVAAPLGVSEIRAVGLLERAAGASREALVQPLATNASLAVPFSAVPALRVRLEPGSHDLACAVFASDRPLEATGVGPPQIGHRLVSLLEDRASRS